MAYTDFVDAHERVHSTYHFPWNRPVLGFCRVGPTGNALRVPTDVGLCCIHWFAAYPLSYRHLEEMMGQRSVEVDHSSINRWAIRYLPPLKQAFRQH